MALLWKETELDPGRDSNQMYEGYATTASDTLATYSVQLPYDNGQPRCAQGVTASGTGNLNLVLDNEGNTAVVAVVTANTVIPISFIQIKATLTTATGITALFRKGG